MVVVVGGVASQSPLVELLRQARRKQDAEIGGNRRRQEGGHHSPGGDAIREGDIGWKGGRAGENMGEHGMCEREGPSLL